MYKVEPLERKLPYNMKEDIWEASYTIIRNNRKIVIYERGQTPQIAKRKLFNLLNK